MLGYMGSARGDLLDGGFAKLQGKDFNYVMQSYEITVGCSTKKEKVDLDLSALIFSDLNDLIFVCGGSSFKNIYGPTKTELPASVSISFSMIDQTPSVLALHSINHLFL